MRLSLCLFSLLFIPSFAFGANKDIVELQRDIATLQDQVRTLQSSTDQKLAAITVLLQQTLDARVPVLGVCLGAQLLVRAFGCRVFRASRRELGFPEISLTSAAGDDPVLGALPSSPRFFQWHEDAFAEPPSATVLARGDDEGGGVQAFRHGSCWGVQFHPEVTAEELDRWFTDNAETLHHGWGRVQSELRAEMAEHLPTANELGAELFRRFARHVRQHSAL